MGSNRQTLTLDKFANKAAQRALWYKPSKSFGTIKFMQRGPTPKVAKFQPQ